MTNITSDQALAANSILYHGWQNGVNEAFCPVVGEGGEFSDYQTECLEYYTTSKA